MEQKSIEEIAKELMKVEGEARGVAFRTDAKFILKKTGKAGLKKIEEELKKIGYPIKFEKTQLMGLYPVGLRVLSILVIQKVLNFSKEDIKEMGSVATKEDIKEMGSMAPKASFLIKIFLRYFISVKKSVEEAGEIWRRHYTAGELSGKINEKERCVILKLRNLTLHPLFCCYLEGYFSTLLKLVLRKPVTSEETKCPFKGDDYHEYLLKW